MLLIFVPITNWQLAYIIACFIPNKTHFFQPGYLQKFVSIGDYDASDMKELSMNEGDVVEIMRAGSTGWWYARHLMTLQEGWVPSTYLIPYKKHHSQSQFSVSSMGKLCNIIQQLI